MDTILMQIKDVPGTSQLAGYADQIEVLSYSHGVAMQVTGDVGNTERTSGTAGGGEFHVTKYLDAATPLMSQKCCEAASLGEVKLTVGRNDGGTVIPFIIYTLSDVFITSIHGDIDGGDKPVESLTLNYSAIEWDYTAQKEA